MKKVIVVSVIVLLVTMAAGAQSFVLGAKGMFSMNLGSTFEGSFKIFPGYENKVLLGGGGSLFGRYNFPLKLPKQSKLGLQLELIVSANNGKGYIGKTIRENALRYVYTSIDIPLLVTYKIPVNIFGLTFSLGPNFSLPLGKIMVKGFGDFKDSSDPGVELYHLNVGMSASVSLDYDVGSGNVLFEARYLNDFMPSTSRTRSHTKIMTRRALQLSVGFQVDL